MQTYGGHRGVSLHASCAVFNPVLFVTNPPDKLLIMHDTISANEVFATSCNSDRLFADKPNRVLPKIARRNAGPTNVRRNARKSGT